MRRLSSATRFFVAATLWALPYAAAAREVSVPIELDAGFVRRVFISQVYTATDQTAHVWDDGSGCNFLILSAPDLTIGDGTVRVTSPAKARVGTLVLGRCLSVVDWSGFVEVDEEPVLAASAATLGFRVVDSHLYGPKHEKQVASGVIWDWIKQYVQPRLATVTIDLAEPLADLRSFLPLVLPHETSDRVQTILDSMSLANVRAADSVLAADLHFDVPPRAEASPVESPSPEPVESPSPEPTLTTAELLAWDSAFESWDAFVTFVVKQAGSDATADDLRNELFGVLLDSRYDLIEALAPTTTHATDPVRELFVKTWSRLGPTMRHLSADLPVEASLRYIGFITATDALAALDNLGPDLGIEISSDGLRRLARIIAPTTTVDPLSFSFDVDPELRKLAGFGPPLDAPPPNPDVDISRGIVPELFRWLDPSAWASLPPDAISRLNRWVPGRDDLDDYLPLVRDLLGETAAQGLARRDLETQYHPLYRWLVAATAWKESCWRQFVRQGKTIKPLSSNVGAVGMMQVNQRVWRGMYQVQGLRGDISYNAKAGSEIVMYYLADYALKKGEQKTGNVDNAARATYCIYNGGPAAIKRYRDPKASREGRRIDEKFWQIYQAVKAGNEMDVVQCWGS